MQESLRSDFAPAQIARQVLKFITFGACLASAGTVALLFYQGGLEQAKETASIEFTLIGGKVGGANSLPPEARGRASIGSRAFNEKDEFLGCLGPDGINITEDYCSE